MSFEPETRYARTPAGAVAYQVVGDGPIDLVFVTPWGHSIMLWWEQPLIERFLRRLASFARLIVFDKRGEGASDAVPLGALPTLEEWCDDIRVVMDEAGSEKAAILGQGPGSPMALMFAATHPDRTSALVVADGFARAVRSTDYPTGVPEHLVDAAVSLLHNLVDGDPGVMRLLSPSLAADEHVRRWFIRYVRLSAAPSAIERIYRLGFEWDLRSVLPVIRVPTLVLHRKDDRFVLVEHGRYLAHHIPNARYVELPGDDHLWFAGDQDDLLDEIQAFLTGTRGAPDIDRVLATVMFTDIVASTQRAAELGDWRWREVLDAHDALSRREIERFRGNLVNTTGDGVLATFDGPARAIRCAQAIAENVGVLGIEIRAGLHTGEIETRGTDIGGLAVNLASRVSDEAGPGEVLVSNTVKDLVVGSGIDFEDRGMHRLKGVPGEWRVYRVKIPRR